jgi:hypothetical protein
LFFVGVGAVASAAWLMAQQVTVQLKKEEHVWEDLTQPRKKVKGKRQKGKGSEWGFAVFLFFYLLPFTFYLYFCPIRSEAPE